MHRAITQNRTVRGPARLAPALAAAAALALSPAAQSAETINLTAIDGYPTKALWVKEFTGLMSAARKRPTIW